RKDLGLMVMNADGTDPHPLLLERANEQSSGAWTSWSPDGKQIAFAGRTDGVWLEDSTFGSGTRVATGQNTSPTWSPDGTRIAFDAWRGPGVFEIVTVRPDGTDQQVLGRGSHPVWGL